MFCLHHPAFIFCCLIVLQLLCHFYILLSGLSKLQQKEKKKKERKSQKVVLKSILVYKQFNINGDIKRFEITHHFVLFTVQHLWHFQEGEDGIFDAME